MGMPAAARAAHRPRRRRRDDPSVRERGARRLSADKDAASRSFYRFEGRFYCLIFGLLLPAGHGRLDRAVRALPIFECAKRPFLRIVDRQVELGKRVETLQSVLRRPSPRSVDGPTITIEGLEL